MSSNSVPTVEGPLSECRVLVPENRQLDILATLIENRGGQVRRVPLVSIHDAPDPEPVARWLEMFIAQPPDLLILLTGEGLRRLLSLAERRGIRDEFVATLNQVPLLIRGPKPGRVLNDLKIRARYPAAEPTTEGVITTLEGMELQGKRVGVQLYGTDPNTRLTDFLSQQQATVLTVAPYVYADQSEEALVRQAISDMADGAVDMIAFTSQPQIRRLEQVAGKFQLETELKQGLERVHIACVGPVVRDRLQEAGLSVSIMPDKSFFMKPLVTAMVRFWQSGQGHS